MAGSPELAERVVDVLRKGGVSKVSIDEKRGINYCATYFIALTGYHPWF
jgi:aromatic ring-opening dioxygenase catalytic subunit (LigB family)